MREKRERERNGEAAKESERSSYLVGSPFTIRASSPKNMGRNKNIDRAEQARLILRFNYFLN